MRIQLPNEPASRMGVSLVVTHDGRLPRRAKKTMKSMAARVGTLEIARYVAAATASLE